MSDSKNSKSVSKLFWLWEDNKYEAWLHEMSLKGWHLIGVNWFGYKFHFVKSTPKDYIYKLDFKTTTDYDLADYLSLYTDAGWEYVGRDVTWKYFRKESQNCCDEDIYTDNSSKLSKYFDIKKVLLICDIYILIFFISIINFIIFYKIAYDELSFMYITLGILYTFITILLNVGIFKISNRIKKLKNPLEL